MNEIGEMFNLARESSGVSLKEASKDLHIKVEILENIEAGRLGAFKDIFELKEHIVNYSKYLGLDTNKMIDEFNDYMFEYTSKIPIKEIEKTIELQIKEEKKEPIISPYTKEKKKYTNAYYIVIYLVIFILVVLAIVWSVKQVTIDTQEATTISYRR